MQKNKTLDIIAEQCYIKTGSVHTDYFDYVKYAELLIDAIHKEVQKELIPHEYLGDENEDREDRIYLQGCNDGAVDCLIRIKNFGKDIE